MPGRESLADKRRRARQITRGLERLHPQAGIALRFASPLELLVATILAAQCTDERVNQVTEGLFHRYRTARDYAAVDPAALEREIHSTGFFRMKARAIVGMAQALLERHGGEVPSTLEALTALPGVGRKTANVVLGNAFGVPGIAVDTHVLRLSGRLGLARSQNPEEVEAELRETLPRPSWTRFCHLVQAHGRQVCLARNPLCVSCGVRALCPWPDKTSPTPRPPGPEPVPAGQPASGRRRPSPRARSASPRPRSTPPPARRAR